MSQEDNTQTNGLEHLVNGFGEVFFCLGGFAYDEDYKLEDVNEALDAYRKIKEEYPGDTTIYDLEINCTLDTFPDLRDIPRV